MENIPADALMYACLAGDAAAVSRLLPAGTRVNLSGAEFQHPVDKSTPLILATTLGHTDIVRMILERAPNTAVGHVTATGATALLMAAQCHHYDILTLLLVAGRGGNVNLADKRARGGTPLRAAVDGVDHDERPRAPASPFLTQLSRLNIRDCATV